MSTQGFRAIVVGAGMAGLQMAEHLKRAGIGFTVYERADEVGGTWRDNTFPGLYVDVLSRQYEYPFAPNDWSRKFAPGPEIQAYLQRVAEERGLRRFIKFGTEVQEARYGQGRWHVTLCDGGVDVADMLVCATGFLSVPVYPDIPGRGAFAGPAFHSARWDHSVPIAGRRWGIIGSGASGVQITEALAYEDCKVVQFVRRAQWVQIRDNPPTTEAERVRVNDPLEYPRLQRELWNAYSESDRWRLVPGAQRDAMERQFRGFLETVRDPELRQKLTPQYNLGCTRIPKSDRYYEAVQRPNVRIETTGIECIVPEGVRLKDGTTVELDVIVYATGFDAHAYMRPMTVVGLDGLTVGELWKDGVFSYRGVGLPGFPNLFMLYGPFSPVNNVSVPLGLEQEIDYILRIVSIARKRGAAVMPTLDATRRFVDRMRRSMPGTVWVGCRNWYSDRGLPILWPLPQDDHAALLAEVDVDELEFVSA